MFSPKNLRLILWIISIVAVLIGSRFRVGYIGLAVIFLLLCTTPADAIRLPRWVSEILIFSCSAMMQMAGHRAGVVIHLVIVIGTLSILRLWGKSAWWAVLYAWFR